MLVTNKRLKFSSAKKIQNCLRIYCARGFVRREKLRVRKVGARFRKLIRKRIKVQNDHLATEASKTVQKFWRQVLPKCLLHHQTIASSKIQNCWRCMQSRMKYEDKLASQMLLFGRSARLIQAAYKYMLWWRVQKQLAVVFFNDCQAYHNERVHCAGMIQREFRSYKNKGIARTLIAHRRNQNKSATRIQNMFRNWVAKTAVERIKKFKMYLAMNWKLLTDKVVLRHKNKFCKKIQKMVIFKLWWEKRKFSGELAKRASFEEDSSDDVREMLTHLIRSARSFRSSFSWLHPALLQRFLGPANFQPYNIRNSIRGSGENSVLLPHIFREVIQGGSLGAQARIVQHDSAKVQKVEGVER